MKVPLQIVNDSEGNAQAVLVPLDEWNEMVEKMRHYEQLLKLRSSIGKAMDQVTRMRSGKLKKRTLKDVLREA